MRIDFSRLRAIRDAARDRLNAARKNAAATFFDSRSPAPPTDAKPTDQGTVSLLELRAGKKPAHG